MKKQNDKNNQPLEIKNRKEQSSSHKGTNKERLRTVFETVDQTILADFALNDTNSKVRREATLRLKDENILTKIEKKETSLGVRLATIEGISNQSTLMNIALESSDEKNIAKIQTKIIDSDAQKRVDTHLTSIRFNIALRSFDEEIITNILGQISDADLRGRIDAHLSTIRSRKKSSIKRYRKKRVLTFFSKLFGGSDGAKHARTSTKATPSLQQKTNDTKFFSENLEKLKLRLRSDSHFAKVTVSLNGKNLKAWVPVLSKEEISQAVKTAQAVLSIPKDNVSHQPVEKEKNEDSNSNVELTKIIIKDTIIREVEVTGIKINKTN